MNNVQTVFEARQAKVFGESLWAPLAVIARAQQCSNTDADALEADADIKSLAAPAMYYQVGKFGNLQLVIKYEPNVWGYANLMHDKDGDPIVDEEHTYTVKDVVAVRDFTLEGEDTPIITKGLQVTKAYTAS